MDNIPPWDGTPWTSYGPDGPVFIEPHAVNSVWRIVRKGQKIANSMHMCGKKGAQLPEQLTSYTLSWVVLRRSRNRASPWRPWFTYKIGPFWVGGGDGLPIPRFQELRRLLIPQWELRGVKSLDGHSVAIRISQKCMDALMHDIVGVVPHETPPETWTRMSDIHLCRCTCTRL
jgi:hypothetical protein